jgi:proteasome lid subunit RPN8/RPN11
MSQKSKLATGQPALVIQGEVVRKIRQHARSSIKTEICGVLIGHDRPGRIEIQACIPGENAEQAGAHVTFTQDTWEHIYQVKDKEYPEDRIVGWYHSHPGFGIFLSDHDAFIHKNFFASPGQVAWVFDPHSDEEGCFGWVSGQIERLSQVSVLDRRGGERVQENGRPESPIAESEPSISIATPSHEREFVEHSAFAESTTEHGSNDSLARLVTNVFSHLTVFLLGFLLAWYFFPRIELVGVPVDPMTGTPLPGYSMQPVPGNSGKPMPEPSTGHNAGSANQDSKPDANGSKENNGRAK